MTDKHIAAFLPGSKLKMNHSDKKIIEVKDQLAVLQRQREAARLERAKSYADAFIRKLEADDIPLAMGLQALQDLSIVSRAASMSSPRNLPRRSWACQRSPVPTSAARDTSSRSCVRVTGCSPMIKAVWRWCGTCG
jgi:hypothetical protein